MARLLPITLVSVRAMSITSSTARIIRDIKAIPILIGTQVQDLSSYADAQTSALDSILGIFGVMLALTVLIALFGIDNTRRLIAEALA